MNINNILFYTGFAEELSNSCVILSNEQGFRDGTQAITNLGKAFRNSIKVNTNILCRNCNIYVNEQNICVQCGAHLLVPIIDLDMVSDIIYDFNAGRGNNNGNGFIVNRLEELGWAIPHDMRKVYPGNTINILAEAEWVLSNFAFDQVVKSEYIILPIDIRPNKNE